MAFKLTKMAKVKNMSNKSGVNNPAISIPKGGGAIKGIGETFQPDLFTGTGNFSVPIITSPGRNDFGPKLTLQYSTGSGNGPFGLGWQISIPRITRKTEKGIPKYADEDIFVISGAEDLVPVLDKYSNLPFYINRVNYTIYRYRPRTEGSFSRIEKWVRDDGDIHWRVITKENITNIYGKSDSTRLFDSKNTRHIFEWFLEETFDAKGNHILYEYEKENLNIKIPKIYEENRHYNQIYIRRILYGNVPDDLDKSKKVGPFKVGSDGTANGTKSRGYLFEVLFDYGDLPILPPIPYNPLGFSKKFIDEWPIREDPSSSFRSGFEIRTLRRCQRVLMLHHFAEGELIGAPLVKSTNFEYSINKDTQLSMLRSVNVIGFKKSNSNVYISSEMPPVTFSYSEFKPLTQKFQSLTVNGNNFPPMALNNPDYTLIDLFGNGLPDILYTSENAYYYWRNLGDGNFDRRNVQQNMPIGITLSNPDVAIGDLGGDGLADIIVRTPSISGFYEATPIGTWKPYKKFDQVPSFDLSDPNVQLVDLTGDGLSDIIVSQENNFLWYRCLGATGYDEPRRIPRIYDLNDFPDVYFNDPEGRIRFADMNGDGLNDIVMIHNGRIDYWTNLGYGRFSKRLTMANFPHFDYTFNLKRLFLVDLDGSGCDDLVYVDFNEVHFWFNQSGNSWGEKQTIVGTPSITDVNSIQFADIYGTGLKCLVWSFNYDEHPDRNYKILDFCGGVKPYLLNEMSNNMGATTKVKYASSTKFYLEDLNTSREWITNLPFPVQVVEKTEMIDHINSTKLVNVYKYHHGYYDGREREFRGFGRVDQYDTEAFDVFMNSSLHKDSTLFINKQKGFHVPPVLTKTWFHSGIYFDEKISSARNQIYDEKDMMELYRKEFFNGDTYAFKLDDHVIENGDIPHEAYRTLRGSIIRKEVYGLDNTERQDIPYNVLENRYKVIQLQAQKSNKNSVNIPIQIESLTFHYERNPSDPRISHQIILQVDDYGNVTDSVSIAYPRRPSYAIYEEQKNIKISYTWSKFINEDTFDTDVEDLYYIGISCEIKKYEIHGLDWKWSSSPFKHNYLLNSTHFSTIIRPDNFKPYNYIPPGDLSLLEKRIIEWTRTYFRKNENYMIIDEIGNLSNRLPLGNIESLGLIYESYNAVFTDEMLKEIYGENRIKPWQDGGYHPHPNHPNAEIDGSSYYWIPSGRKAFNAKKFYQVEQNQDLFGEITISEYDIYGLMVKSIEDAWSTKHISDEDLKHKTKSEINYRVLTPYKVIDPNGNTTEVKFNRLGMVVGIIVNGTDENGAFIGDSFSDFVEDLDENEISYYIDNPLANPHKILKNASTRIVYDINRFFRERLPNVIFRISREVYSSENGGDTSRIQHCFVYSDGCGREIQSKIKAESGVIDGSYVTNRWTGTGTKIYNNKGNLVKEFEPFFSNTHHFGIEEYGVSPLLLYDPLDRLICKIHPNHTYEKSVFDPWRREIWDVNDNIHPDFLFNPNTPNILPDHNYNPVNDAAVGHYFQNIPEESYLPTWYNLRMDTIKAQEKWADSHMSNIEKKCAESTAKHSATPTVVHLDVLGRKFLTIANNGIDQSGDNIYLETLVKLDIEGNEIVIIDPRKVETITNTFDIYGRELLIETKDSGLHLSFLNSVNKLIYEWDSNGHKKVIKYDELQRPKEMWVQNGTKIRLVERAIYGDEKPNAKNFNLIGKIYKQYDGAGLLTCDMYDLKGNCTKKVRQVIKNSDIEQSFSKGNFVSLDIDWNFHGESILDPDKHVIIQKYDTLNRIIEIIYPDSSVASIKYNDASFIECIMLDENPYIKEIDYDEKGQITRILYGNDVQTEYYYDPETFLVRRIHTRTNQGTGKSFQDLYYYYDPMGNVSIIDDKIKWGKNHHDLEKLMQQKREYIYDPLYRLICAKGKECTNVPSPLKNKLKIPLCTDHSATRPYSRKYTYDRSGNIVKISHKAPYQGTIISNWNINFSYGTTEITDKNNRLTEIKTSQGKKNLSYDLNGNLISIANNQRFYWDHANRMIAATTSTISESSNTSMQAQYFYDNDGMRIKKVVKCGNTLKTTIYIDGIYEVYKKKTNLKLKEHKTYKHIMKGEKRIAIIKNVIYHTRLDKEPHILFQHSDLLGSSQVLTSKSGELFNQEEYYPYGETSFGSYAKKRYRYSGKERDTETGLYYYGVRYYSPYLNRWVSCDPGGSIEGKNVYIFASNNPVSFHDPIGLNEEPTNESNPQQEPKLIKQQFSNPKIEFWGFEDIQENNEKENVLQVVEDAVKWVDQTIKQLRHEFRENKEMINKMCTAKLTWRTKRKIINNYRKILDGLKNKVVTFSRHKEQPTEPGHEEDPACYVPTQTIKYDHKKSPPTTVKEHIRLYPRFFESDKQSKVNTIIHEASHQFAGTEDPDENKPISPWKNAYKYAEFAVEIHYLFGIKEKLQNR